MNRVMPIRLLVLSVALAAIASGLPAVGQDRVRVPSVIGKTEAEAKTILTQLGFDVKVTDRIAPASPEGRVLEQRPNPRLAMSQLKGSTVEIIVAHADPPPPPGAPRVMLPRLIGLDEAAASQVLQ